MAGLPMTSAEGRCAKCLIGGTQTRRSRQAKGAATQTVLISLYHTLTVRSHCPCDDSPRCSAPAAPLAVSSIGGTILCRRLKGAWPGWRKPLPVKKT